MRKTSLAIPKPSLFAKLFLSLLALMVCAAITPHAAHAADSSPAGENAFSQADTNHDGCVSLHEWERAHTDKDAFYKADQGHAGCLDQTAFLKAEAISTGHQAGRYLSDTWVTAKVKAALLKDEKLKGFDVKVNTHRGVVQLSGRVDNPDLAHRAVKIAAAVEGVTGVRDNLNVK